MFRLAFSVGAFGCVSGCAAWHASPYGSTRRDVALVLFLLGWGAMILAAYINEDEGHV